MLSQFSEKLTDTVKNVGEPATLRFSTEYTAPDLLRWFLNGTNATLVSSGKVTYLEVGPRYRVTSIRRDPPYRGYDVTISISEVEKKDAGTYLAKSDDDFAGSMKNYMELVVTGRLKFYAINI